MVMIRNHFHEVKYVENNEKFAIKNEKSLLCDEREQKELVREIERERESKRYTERQKKFS